MNQTNLQSLWMEGSNSWASNALFFTTADPQRRHLLATINRQEATLEELSARLGLDPGQAAVHLEAMERINLIRKHSQGHYSPAFPILTTDDLELLLPLMQPTIDKYCSIVLELAPRLDQLATSLGLDRQDRMPVFLGFARDEMVFNEMKRRGIFPDKAHSIAGLDCIFAAEPFPSLDSRHRPGLTYSASGPYRLLFIRDNFRHRHLFTRWGFEYYSRATPALAAIMDCLATPTTVGRLAQTLHEKEDVPGLNQLVEQGHLPAALNYLAQQGWVAWQQHWQATPAVISQQHIQQLAALVKPASEVIADLAQHPRLEELYPHTSPRRHAIPLSHFRAAVAWKTIWAATGLLTEQGFFPQTTRELYIFRLD